MLTFGSARRRKRRRHDRVSVQAPNRDLKAVGLQLEASLQVGKTDVPCQLLESVDRIQIS